MDMAIERLLRMYEGGKVTRRGLVRSLAALALGVPLSGAAGFSGVRGSEVASDARPDLVDHGGSGGAQDAPIPVSSLNHVSCSVSDIPGAVEFFQELFGMPLLSDQGTGLNLSASAGGAPTQFVGFYDIGGFGTGIHHLCLGVEDFDVDRITAILEERGIEHNVRMRDGTVPELYLTGPEGISVQLQDVSYCGGSGPLGDQCDPV